MPTSQLCFPLCGKIPGIQIVIYCLLGCMWQEIGTEQKQSLNQGYCVWAVGVSAGFSNILR